jgi:hypothetical protein
LDTLSAQHRSAYHHIGLQYLSFQLSKALCGHLNVLIVHFGAILDHDEVAGKIFEVGPNMCKVASGAAVSIMWYYKNIQESLLFHVLDDLIPATPGTPLALSSVASPKGDTTPVMCLGIESFPHV